MNFLKLPFSRHPANSLPPKETMSTYTHAYTLQTQIQMRHEYYTYRGSTFDLWHLIPIQS